MQFRYAAALGLYRTTKMSVAEICRQTGSHLSPFRSYIYRRHRDMMFARYGIETTGTVAATAKLRERFGQQKNTRVKYRDAIRTCDDVAYIEFNVAQIARMFRLAPSALGNQLRVHYPEILERREKERRRLGVNDNLHCGVKPWCKVQYAEAVHLYETATEPLKAIAKRMGIQYNSIGDFVRRNRPDAIAAHNRLVEQEERRQKEKVQAETAALALKKEIEEKERILRALEQTGGHKRNAAKLLSICKLTLYNKINEYRLTGEF